MFENIASYLCGEDFLLKMNLLVRIVIAVVCGVFIGYERNNRGKGAGIRTHAIVALASCLMMIISKYGFADINAGNGMRGADPSRIAAQIVSGIGFLGAGTIFVQKNTVTGLTTAAGIWATAGIGMAVGDGMYFIGIACTCVIVVIQILLHKKLRILHIQNEKKFKFTIEDSRESIKYITELLDKMGSSVVSISYNRNEKGLLDVSAVLVVPSDLNKTAILNILYEEERIKSVAF